MHRLLVKILRLFVFRVTMVQKRWKWRQLCGCLCALTSLTLVPIVLLLLYSSATYSAGTAPKTQYRLTDHHGCRYAHRWSWAQRFLKACRDAGLLDTFLMEPELLMDIEAGRTDPCLWKQKSARPGITFGVIDPSTKALGRLSYVFNDKTPFHHHVVYATDPRGVSTRFFITKKTHPTIPVHFLWWSRDDDDDDTDSLLLHLVVFRTRGEYLWHAQLSPSTKNQTWSKRKFWQAFPFPVSDLSIGQHAALIDRFTTQQKNIAGADVPVPLNASSFLRGMREGALVECDHDNTRRVVARYPRDMTVGSPRNGFREKVLKVLATAVKTLDKLGLTFWLGSGTLLGWYRQCDVIPYTNDIDLEMRIEDYTPKLTKALEEAGLRLFRQLGKLTDSFELTFQQKMKLDLFFVYEEKNHTWIGMFHPTSYEKYRYTFPKLSLRWAEFAGLRVRVPYPPEAYLQAMYGPNWTEPIKDNGHWLTAPLNKVPAGVWPEWERPRVRNIIR